MAHLYIDTNSLDLRDRIVGCISAPLRLYGLLSGCIMDDLGRKVHRLWRDCDVA